jgi:hypothetical protein
MSLGLLGGCCGPCFGPQFLARQISATVPWYGSFAFAGGLSTTLWLVETHVTAYTDITATYGAGWTAASRTVTTTINQWDGSSSVVTTYSPGGGDATAFNARAALEPGPAILVGSVITSNATVFSFNDVENPVSSNPGLIHLADSDVFTSPVTQDDILAAAHALIDSYISGSPGSFTPLPFSNGTDGLNALLLLSYDSSGAPTSAAVPFVFPFPSTLLASLIIASLEPLISGAVAGDAINLQIGQVLTNYNTWSYLIDLAADPPSGCAYHCLPSGAPESRYTYLLPAVPGDTNIITDPGRNFSSPCDSSPPPTC